MAFDAHSNLSISAVAVPPSPPTTGTSLTITPGHGAARFTGVPPYQVTVQQPGVLPNPSTAEVCRVTSRVGDSFTIVRAQEGTTARAIQAGDLIYVSITAKTLTDIEAAIGTAAPAAHHLTHEDGGSDEVLLAQSQVTGLTGALSGKVETSDPRLADARVPLPHAPSHGVGGSDPVTVTALAGYPGGATAFLRADATFAVPTAGVPTAHHTTHETGGSDALVALAGEVMTSGVIADARLSANVALQNASNEFTVPQFLSLANPVLAWRDTTQAANARLFSLTNTSQTLIVAALLDNFSVAATPLTLSRTGAITVGTTITERGRTVPLGEWEDLPVIPANFTATAGVWTVASATTYRRTRIGTTLWLQFELLGTSLTLATPEIRLNLGGDIAAAQTRIFTDVVQNGVRTIGLGFIAAGSNVVQLFADTAGSSWLAGPGATQVCGQLCLSIF